MRQSVSPSLTTSFNYKDNNMDIADIRLLKRDAESTLLKTLNDFMLKTGVEVRAVEFESIDATTVGDMNKNCRLVTATLEISL